MFRKDIRLEQFDYSRNGAYFITVCTKNKENRFWAEFVGASIARPITDYTDLKKDLYILNDYGKIVESAIKRVYEKYNGLAYIDKYVIMPNHLHFILILRNNFYLNEKRPENAPTVSRVVQQMKGYVTKQIGFSVWQKSFYEHIIRGNDEYIKICEYMDNNPKNWKSDIS